MCLYTNHDFRIAESDIQCYKILYKRKFRFPRAPFMHKLYIRGIKYKIKDLYTIPTCRSGLYRICEGFHCYTDFFHAKSILWKMQDSWISGENLKLYKCIIPAGSKYYIGDNLLTLNENHMVVSNAIIIKHEI